jgi:hypothetical protein
MGEIIPLPVDRDPFTLIARRIRLTESQEDLDLLAEAVERADLSDDSRNALEVLVAKRRRELFRGDTPPGGRAA